MSHHLLCMLLLHLIQYAVSTFWTPVYVNRSFLEVQSDYAMTVVVNSEIACARFAFMRDWAHLFHFENGQCAVTELLRTPSQNTSGIQDPVKCWTHFQKEDFPCATHPNNGYKGYGCVIKNENILSWEDARSYCQSLGMDLVSNELLGTLVQIESIHNGLEFGAARWWIGAHKPDPEVEQFVWVTGENLDKSDLRWHINEHNFDYGEIYVAIMEPYFVDLAASTRESVCGILYP